MLQDRPDVPEILKSVREFITGVLDKLDDQERYHALCANYLLNIVEREFAIGGAIDDAAAAKLRAFLGVDAPLPELSKRLCAAIRSGECDQRWDEAVALVMDQVVGKVKVTKPDHLDPMHR
ncbi:MAG: hypothetical protein HY749_11935 [Gammaproteobacteria bacterium]|nr:hypothetical protein [Gammaproteobacteria bacterium]MBI5616220.1 hypothetical protein [Gammaproteobacteria bacterium]